MLEIWCEDFDPHSFWDQTLRTMISALRGRRNADKLRSKRDLLLAYHTGAFAGAAFNGQLKPFSHYERDSSDDGQRMQNAKGIAFFHRMKARGFPVDIKRVN